MKCVGKTLERGPKGVHKATHNCALLLLRNLAPKVAQMATTRHQMAPQKRGFPWVPMGSHVFPWVSRGFPWVHVGVHGFQMGLHGPPWVPMGSHGCPWVPMGSHGLPWVPMGIVGPHRFPEGSHWLPVGKMFDKYDGGTNNVDLAGAQNYIKGL